MDVDRHSWLVEISKGKMIMKNKRDKAKDFSSDQICRGTVVLLIILVWGHTLMMSHELLASSSSSSVSSSSPSASSEHVTFSVPGGLRMPRINTPQDVRFLRHRKFSSGTRAEKIVSRTEQLFNIGGLRIGDGNDDYSGTSGENSSDKSVYINDVIDDSYFVVFSTGCSEFQDWQSIGVFSSAAAVGQRGIIVRIASGCSQKQEASITHAMTQLPKRCRVHFAPDTDVKDHAGNFYKYANKPLGMMHWLKYGSPQVPTTATVALVDPDMFFLRPLWHDSFDSEDKFIVSGGARYTVMPPRLVPGHTMIAQRCTSVKLLFLPFFSVDVAVAHPTSHRWHRWSALEKQYEARG